MEEADQKTPVQSQRSLEELLVLCIPHVREYFHDTIEFSLKKMGEGKQLTEEEEKKLCWDVTFALTAELAHSNKASLLKKIEGLYDLVEKLLPSEK